MRPTAPLPIGGVLDAGLSLYRAAFVPLAWLALLTMLPAVIFSAAGDFMIGALLEGEAASEEALARRVSALALWAAAEAAVILVTFTFASHAVLHGLACTLRGEPVRMGASVMRGARLTLPYVLLTLVFVLLVSLGTLLLVVPGIVLLVSLSLYAPVPHLEQRSVWASLGRSHQLVFGGNWWRTAVVGTIAFLVTLVLAVLVMAVGLTPVAFGYGEYDAPVILGSAIGEAAAYMLTIPLYQAVTVALYEDLLLRREGADLNARLATLEAAAAEAG